MGQTEAALPVGGREEGGPAWLPPAFQKSLQCNKSRTFCIRVCVEQTTLRQRQVLVPGEGVCGSLVLLDLSLGFHAIQAWGQRRAMPAAVSPQFVIMCLFAWFLNSCPYY